MRHYLEGYEFTSTDPQRKEDDDIFQETVLVIDSQNDPWYQKLIQGIKESPENYPEFMIKNEMVYKHVHHAVNYNERQDAWKLCIPQGMRREIIKENHDDETAGHLGIAKTQKYVRSCQSCQQFKARQQPPPGKMGTIEATKPWEVVAMDIVGPMTKSYKGNCHLLVIQDKFTKWIELQPMKKATTELITEAMRRQVITRFGSPKTIITDNGTQFTSNMFTEALRTYGIQHIRTPPHSPQCNPVERTNRVVKTMIAQFIGDSQRTWDQHLPELAFAYNTAKHETTQFTPAYLNYGRELNQPADMRTQLETDQETEEPDNIQDRVNQLQEAYELVKLNIAKGFTKQAKHYNKKRSDWEPKVGDKVSRKLYTLSSKEGQISTKLAPKYQGEFIIIEKISPVIFLIQGIDGNVHRTHIKDLKPYKQEEIEIIQFESTAKNSSEYPDQSESSDESQGEVENPRHAQRQCAWCTKTNQSGKTYPQPSRRGQCRRGRHGTPAIRSPTVTDETHSSNKQQSVRMSKRGRKESSSDESSTQESDVSRDLYSPTSSPKADPSSAESSPESSQESSQEPSQGDVLNKNKPKEELNKSTTTKKEPAKAQDTGNDEEKVKVPHRIPKVLRKIQSVVQPVMQEVTQPKPAVIQINTIDFSKEDKIEKDKTAAKLRRRQRVEETARRNIMKKEAQKLREQNASITKRTEEDKSNYLSRGKENDGNRKQTQRVPKVSKIVHTEDPRIKWKLVPIGKEYRDQGTQTELIIINPKRK
ncbi:uncharacterized protein LOC123271709 [Cotesia glomerata]|uniref:uncharacterized protein LOC123271709 n=1 Tax=Cotesia glomerata TaxID=32391 RepID=UPI001D018A62|nr:uncharacterized protein LOC123271709 [Cotesia glomerata]